jgi:exodeoxyribonuclease VII large subunit
MSLYFSKERGWLILSGNTFPIKDTLKSAGARWDAQRKMWVLREEELNLVFLEKQGFLERKLSATPSPAQTQNLPSSLEDSLLDVSSSGSPSVSLEKNWQVGEYLAYVEGILTHHLHFEFWIVGEISSFKVSGGHTYFDLSQKKEEREGRVGRSLSVSCALWSGKRLQLEAQAGPLPLAEGVAVRIKVHAEFRKEQSKLVLVVNDCDAQYTLGDMAMTRQNIVRELKKRGLYDANRLRSWPSLPMRIALISAEGSRALSDFLDELSLSQFGFHVSLFDVHMQGDKTSPEVTAALAAISQKPEDYDVVVLARGGGSRLDLRWFDDLPIAKAIAYCPLPVVSAIGHFEDVSVADEVSHRAEKTPTGAARALSQTVAVTLEQCQLALERGAARVSRRLVQLREVLQRQESQLMAAATRRLHLERQRLQSFEQLLRVVKAHAHKPLEKGYSIVRSSNGDVLKGEAFLQSPPSELELELFDKKTSTEIRVRAKVLQIRSQSPQIETATLSPKEASQ